MKKYLSVQPETLGAKLILRRYSNKDFSRSKLNIKSEAVEFLASLQSNRKCKNIYGWSKIHLHIAGFWGRVFLYSSPLLLISCKISVSCDLRLCSVVGQSYR